MTKPTKSPQPLPFPTELRTWRRRRGFSQMALALEAAISTRHLSFLETGKAAPSRDMVQRLIVALGLPEYAENRFLLAAGFAPACSERSLEEDELSPFGAAVSELLSRHDPYPAWALDGSYRITAANDMAGRFLRAAGIGEADSLLERLCADPSLGGMLVNWPEAVGHLARRVRSEAARRGSRYHAEMAAMLRAQAAGAEDGSVTAAIPTVFRYEEQEFAFFSMLALFNTAEDLLLRDVRIELFFPKDQATKDRLAALSERS